MVVFPQSWERGKAGSVIPVLPAPCLCYHGMTPAPNAESGLIFDCDESILWGDDFPSDLIWLTQWKWGDLGSETWSVFLTSKVLPALILFFPPHFTHHFAVIYLSFLIFSCAAPSLFSASLTLSLQPFLLLSVCLHYLQCGKCPNFLPRLIIRCICQGHGLASGSNSPVHLGKEWWDLGRGWEGKQKQGEGVSRCPCAASWCEVLNGGLCRITLVACCIIDITGSVTLHWPASQLLQHALAAMHPLHLRVARVFNFLFPAWCYPTHISLCFYINLLFSFHGFCLQLRCDILVFLPEW